MKTKYCLGFMFNKPLTQVALIRKLKPEWQKNKLNGIGGHIEKGETPIQAMKREFHEETNYELNEQWLEYAKLDGKDFTVFCFTDVGDLENLKAKTKEEVFIINTININPISLYIVENVPWLIGMAIDTLVDGRPKYSTIKY